MPDIATLIAPHRGLQVKTLDETYIFRFYTTEEAGELVHGWVAKELKVPEFTPIGSFCCGDFVCAHPSGTLFVVLHDNFQWWDSNVSLEELITRVIACDEELEEEVYSGNQAHR